jgi:hypothetical protein
VSILSSVLGLDGLPAAVTSITSTVGDVIKRFVPDPDKALEAKTAIEQATKTAIAEQYRSMAETMAADAKSDSWFTRITRPAMVWWSMSTVTFVAAISYFDAAGGKQIVAALGSVPDTFYQLIATGTGAYIVGRSVEKVATSVPGIIDAIKKKL